MGFFKKLFSIFKKKKKSKEDESEKEEVKKEDISKNLYYSILENIEDFSDVCNFNINGIYKKTNIYFDISYIPLRGFWVNRTISSLNSPNKVIYFKWMPDITKSYDQLKNIAREFGSVNEVGKAFSVLKLNLNVTLQDSDGMTAVTAAAYNGLDKILYKIIKLGIASRNFPFNPFWVTVPTGGPLEVKN